MKSLHRSLWSVYSLHVTVSVVATSLLCMECRAFVLGCKLGQGNGYFAGVSHMTMWLIA